VRDINRRIEKNAGAIAEEAPRQKVPPVNLGEVAHLIWEGQFDQL